MPYLKTSKKLNRSRYGNFLIFVMLLSVAFFMGFPLYFNIVQAFKPPAEIFQFPPRPYVVNPTWQNMTLLFQLASNMTVPFNRYLFNSVFTSIISTAIGVVIGAMAAYPFAKKEFTGKKVIWSLIILMLLFQSNDLVKIPVYIIRVQLNLIDNYPALIIPGVASTLYMFLMRQFIATIPDSLLEAAQIDGASEMRILWRIVMPNVKPAWLTVMVLTFIGVWNRGSSGVIFTEPLKLLPTALEQISAGGVTRMGVTAATTLLLIIPPSVAFIITQSKMMQTMAYSGIKD